MSLPPPTAVTGCDSLLLERLLYKYRNQHRKTPYYHKLQQVRRSLRTVAADVKRALEESGLGDAPEAEGDERTIAALVEPRSAAHLARLESLVHSLVSSQRVITHCSRPLYGLLSQTYFMSFALASLALLARLYATQRAMLLPILDKCVQARETAKGSTRAPAAASFAQRLYRAMRTEVDEREWLERCDAVPDLFASCSDASEGGATSSNEEAPKPAPPAALHSDGDSDEEDDTPMPAAAVALPSQLKFFASPAAPQQKKQLQPPAVLQTPGKKSPVPLPTTPQPAVSAVVTPHRALKRPASALAPAAAAAAAAAATPRNVVDVSDSEDGGGGDGDEAESNDVDVVEVPQQAVAARAAASSAPSAASKASAASRNVQAVRPQSDSKLAPPAKKQKVLAKAAVPASAVAGTSLATIPAAPTPPTASASASLPLAPPKQPAAVGKVKNAAVTGAAGSKTQGGKKSSGSPPVRDLTTGAAVTGSAAAGIAALLPASMRTPLPLPLPPSGKKKKIAVKAKKPAADEMDDIFG